MIAVIPRRIAKIGGDHAERTGPIFPDAPNANITFEKVYSIKPDIIPDKIRLFTLSDLINLTENGAAIINIEHRKRGRANKD